MNFDRTTSILKMNLEKNKLIGDKLSVCIDNNEYVKYIHTIAENSLIERIEGRAGYLENLEEIIISLSIIAIQEYDSSYWNYVEDTYVKLYDKYSKVKIDNFIKEILRRYGKYDDQLKNSKRLINIPIIQSIVPKKHMNRFYEFIFDIYKINFGHSIPENVNDELKYVFQNLSNKISNDGDELKISVTKKSYKLINSTQYIIKNNYDLDSLISICEKVLRIVDKHYWQEEISHRYSSYFIEGFEKWETLSDNEKIVKEMHESRVNSLQRWKPTFKQNGTEIYLFTPIHRIKQSHDPKNIVMKLYNGNKLIEQRENLHVQEVIGGYIVKQNKFTVENPLRELTYKLIENDEVIYDSQNKLHRKYLLFDKNGNEVQNNKDFQENIIVCFDLLNECDERINILYKSKSYAIGEFTPDKDEVYKIGSEFICLSAKIKPGIRGNIINNVQIEIGDQKYDVYKNVDYITLETALKSDEIGVYINGKRHRLNELKYEEFNRGVYTNYTVNIRNYTSIINEFQFFEIKRNLNIQSSKFKFIIDKSFSYEVTNISRHIYDVEIVSSFDLLDISGNITNNIELNTDIDDTFVASIVCDKKQGKVILDINIPFYRIDNGKWLEFDEYIWHGDISANSTKIEFKGIEVNVVDILDTNLHKLNDFKVEKNIADISALKRHSNDEKIIMRVKEGMRIKDIEVLNRCIYNERESSIEFDEISNEVIVKTVYDGKSKIEVVVKNANDEIIYKEGIGDNGINIVKGLKTFNSYKYELIETVSVGFFSKPIVIAQKWHKFFIPNDLLNKYFRIDSVTLNDPDPKKEKDKKVKDTFIKINEYIIKDDNYIGDIFTSVNSNYVYLDVINPVVISLTTDYIDNNTIKLEMKDEDEDTLLWDENKNSVLNLEDAHDVCDIYEYKIYLGKR